MQSVTISLRDGRVALINNTTKVGIGLTWDRALDLGRALCSAARNLIDRMSIGLLAVRHENQIVLLEDHSKILFALPSKAALEVGNSLIEKSHLLEEIHKADEVAFDHAILQRLGVNLGLTDNKEIQKIAGKEAAWNHDLRRYICGAKLRQHQVGTPRVTKP